MAVELLEKTLDGNIGDVVTTLSDYEERVLIAHGKAKPSGVAQPELPAVENKKGGKE